MGILRISLFGSVRVTHGSWQEEIKLTRTIQLLLAYLIVERNRLHPREALLDLFWSEYNPERARSCLNTALWRLRKALEPQGEHQGRYLITSHTGDVGFNLECDCWLDLAVFEGQANRALQAPVERAGTAEVQQLEEALGLYTGDLLEGVYEDWALAAREHTRLLYIRSLDYLMRYYRRQQDHARSIEYALEILNLDPLREEIHRALMRLYMECGQRSLAVRQYESCRRLLLEELGIPPMLETRALYDRIIGAPAEREPFEPRQASFPPQGRNGNGSSLPEPASANGDLKLILRELHQASQNLELANRQFSRVLRRLEEYTSSESS